MILNEHNRLEISPEILNSLWQHLAHQSRITPVNIFLYSISLSQNSLKSKVPSFNPGHILIGQDSDGRLEGYAIRVHSKSLLETLLSGGVGKRFSLTFRKLDGVTDTQE